MLVCLSFIVGAIAIGLAPHKLRRHATGNNTDSIISSIALISFDNPHPLLRARKATLIGAYTDCGTPVDATRSLSVNCATFMASLSLGMPELREVQTPARAGGALCLAGGTEGREWMGSCHKCLTTCYTMMVQSKSGSPRWKTKRPPQS